MIDTYAPLDFCGTKLAAATPILKTTLGSALGEHCLDYSDGTLRITINADVFARFDRRQVVLWGVLEQIAGHVSTVTLHDIANRLDEDSKRAVTEAYARLFGLSEVAA